MEGYVCYAAKGNKTDEFYRYEYGDSWRARTQIPSGPSGKPAYKGCRGVSDGTRYIYMTKGSKTCEYWRYDVALDSWAQLPDVPFGPSGKPVKSGVDLVYVTLRDTGFVHMLKGNTSEFLRYNVLTRTWNVLPPAPVSARSGYKEGSWLCYDDDASIYCHRACYHELHRFDMATGTWDARALAGMPLVGASGREKKSRDGSSAAWYFGRVLAFKGGNTDEYWCYNTATDSWRQRGALPLEGSTGKKRVKSGADFIRIHRTGIYLVTKGNKTRELWEFAETEPDRHDIGPDGVQTAAVDVPRRLADVESCLGNGLATLAIPELQEGSRVVVCDAAGRVVKRASLTAGRINVSRMAAGVYYVRAYGERRTSVRRIQIVR